MGGKAFRVNMHIVGRSSKQILFQIYAHACVCTKSSAIKDTDSKMNANLTRCCKETLKINYDKKTREVSCPLQNGVEVGKEVRACENPKYWESIPWNKTRMTNNNTIQVSNTVPVGFVP